MEEAGEDMRGKVCLVTGATSGIGEVTARELARRGATVVVSGRSRQKAEATVAEIQSQTDNENVEYLLADLSSQQETRGLANEFKARHDRLDVLVNNAGAIYADYGETEDGIERTFAVNHLSYFLLTNLLGPLKASAPSRIVNVASGAHQGAELDFDNLGTKQDYGFMKAYGRSKLANVMFTYELSRRLEGTGVTANALHPGTVATSFGSNNAAWYARPLLAFFRLFATTPEKGAETSVYLASSPEVEDVTGEYFVNKKPVSSSTASYDEEAARRLWRVSEEFCAMDSG